MLMFALLPLGLVATWRTHAHAKRYLRTERSTLRGVLEAAAVGFVFPVLTVGALSLAVSGFSFSARGLSLIAVVGFAGFLVAFMIGLVLHFVALFVLHMVMQSRRVTEQESTSGI